MLLEAGANEYSRDAYGYTPLNLSMGGEMCKLLHHVRTHLYPCTNITLLMMNWVYYVEGLCRLAKLGR